MTERFDDKGEGLTENQVYGELLAAISASGLHCTETVYEVSENEDEIASYWTGSMTLDAAPFQPMASHLGGWARCSIGGGTIDADWSMVGITVKPVNIFDKRRHQFIVHPPTEENDLIVVHGVAERAPRGHIYKYMIPESNVLALEDPAAFVSNLTQALKQYAQDKQPRKAA